MCYAKRVCVMLKQFANVKHLPIFIICQCSSFANVYHLPIFIICKCLSFAYVYHLSMKKSENGHGWLSMPTISISQFSHGENALLIGIDRKYILMTKLGKNVSQNTYYEDTLF